MIRFLFLDLDDTILDFHKAESIALRKALLDLGVDPTDDICARYSEINHQHWLMLERKELTREQLLVQRFVVLFRELGKTVDPIACARTYERNLGIGHYFLPGAEEALQVLSQKYRLFLTSNGTSRVQAGRLDSANIRQYFEKVFVSEDVGANKPSKMYFDRCFAQIPDFNPQQAMIVGDSLTSDILGGKNAGIQTCWVNSDRKVRNPEIVPDYEIERLSQLDSLLMGL